MAAGLRDRDERTGAAVDAVVDAAVLTDAAPLADAQADAAPVDATAPVTAEASDAADHPIQWHPAFCCAMELELAGESASLTFEREHNLSSKPLQVDLLVIVNEGGPLSDPVARAFRRYNLVEYKSPGDGMDVDDFYKLLAYGCLYKALRGRGPDGIPAGEVTLTLAREARPEGMLAALARQGFAAAEESPGVYRLEGPAPFACQLVVTRELPEDGHAWLRALTRDMTVAQASALVAEVRALPEGTAERRYADAVLHVALKANGDTFENANREDSDMSNFFERELDRRIEESQLTSIRNLMKSLGMSASQAMDGMGITDPATRKRYARLVAEQAEPAKEAAAR